MKLIYKTFSKKDYKGLDEDQVRELKSQRKKIAKKILEERKTTKSLYNRALGDINKSYENNSRGEIFGKKISDEFSPEDIKNRNIDKADEYLKRRYDRILLDAGDEKKKAVRYIKSSKFRKDNKIYKKIKGEPEPEKISIRRAVKNLYGKVKNKIKHKKPEIPVTTSTKDDVKNIIKGLNKHQKLAIGATAGVGIGYGSYKFIENQKEKNKFNKIHKHILNKD